MLWSFFCRFLMQWSILCTFQCSNHFYFQCNDHFSVCFQCSGLLFSVSDQCTGYFCLSQSGDHVSVPVQWSFSSLFQYSGHFSVTLLWSFICKMWRYLCVIPNAVIFWFFFLCRFLMQWSILCTFQCSNHSYFQCNDHFSVCFQCSGLLFSVSDQWTGCFYDR